MSDYNKPDFGHLTDREILIVVATEQSTIQSRLNDHGKRIRVLEGLAKTISGMGIVAAIVAGWFKVNAKVQ